MAFGVDARITCRRARRVRVHTARRPLADSMARGAAGEAGSTFPGKGGLAMNILLGPEAAVHGFEHGPGEGSGLGWPASFRGARGMSGTGTFPVIVRGVGMGGRCGIGKRAVGAGSSGKDRFPGGWARIVRTLSPTRSRKTRRPAFASILRVGLCRCGPGLRSGWSDRSLVSRRAATTKGSSRTTSCRAWTEDAGRAGTARL